MENLRFILVTGLSGAGKTRAIQSLEDIGFFCVDNLPPSFIPKFAELCACSEGKIQRVALVCDVRGGEFFSELLTSLNELEKMGMGYEVLFLEASDEVLIRRYKETRRRHPLVSKGSISEGIREERILLEDIRGNADKIIDTSRLTPQQLKEEIVGFYTQDKTRERLFIILVSFGFKFGLPLDADLVFDVRFLPNPHYVPRLQPLTGNEKEVKEYVESWAITGKFLEKVQEMLTFLLPCYSKEGKSQLVIAIGCTGGKHRAVVITNKLATFLQELNFQVAVEHRDIMKK